jgi:shikimate kinase
MNAELCCPLFLIGFMGAGKSSVAQYLASTYDMPAVDTDEAIEQTIGQTVADYFAREGEQAFRARETECLRRLSGSPAIVACGGGIVERPENREIMRASGRTILLDASFDDIAARIEDRSTRPLFQDKHAAHDLFDRRQSLYRSTADTVIDTSGKTVQEICAIVISYAKCEGIVR